MSAELTPAGQLIEPELGNFSLESTQLAGAQLDKAAQVASAALAGEVRGSMAGTGPAAPLPPAGEQSMLLIWDAPNIDMGLGAILGGRPSSDHRPRFDAVGRWLLERATAAQLEPEATVFTNVQVGSAESIRPWVDALRNMGFAVFAKPKLKEDTDVDPDMLELIKLRHRQGVLRHVVIVSADGQNFYPTLRALAAAGVSATVLGFHEHAAWAVADPELEFVDFEDIPGVFREPLPRINLDSLPQDGAWLRPFRPLADLLRSGTAGNR